MDVSSKPQSQDNGITAPIGHNPSVCTVSESCEGRLLALLNPHQDGRCHAQARQLCAKCDAKLCDVHAEFCAICLTFLCEGCLDLHNEEGQHAEGNLGELVARVFEEVAG
jgi:hypothetical protein